jgi:hypothetical protein
VSHQVQPTLQPWRRMNTAGTPAVGPSPWMEWKTSATRPGEGRGPAVLAPLVMERARRPAYHAPELAPGRGALV